jgi:DNA-directed RNA polymerase subunit M/transcription elongation factor TFIIS
MKDPKILYIDIENSRMVVEFETYSLYNNDVIHPRHIKHDWYITCAAWAWLDAKKQKVGKIETVAVNDFKTYKKDFRDDRGVVKKLHKVLSEADLIVGHNSDKFDLKKINYKFIKHGLPTIDLPATVDTLKVAKKYAGASSNRLYYLAREFGVSMKIDLPSSVMHQADNGCEKSLKKVIAYNKGDIRAGAGVYFKLLPHIKNHPNIDKLMGRKVKKERPNCQNCGSKKVQSNGLRTTKAGRFRYYRCHDCGSSTKGERA